MSFSYSPNNDDAVPTIQPTHPPAARTHHPTKLNRISTMIRYKTTTATSSTLRPLRDDGVPLLHNFRQFRADQLKFWLETGRMGPLMRGRFAPREPVQSLPPGKKNKK